MKLPEPIGFSLRPMHLGCLAGIVCGYCGLPDTLIGSPPTEVDPEAWTLGTIVLVPHVWGRPACPDCLTTITSDSGRAFLSEAKDGMVRWTEVLAEHDGINGDEDPRLQYPPVLPEGDRE